MLCLFQNWKSEDNLKIPLPTIHTTSWSWRECENTLGNDLAGFLGLVVFFTFGWKLTLTTALEGLLTVLLVVITWKKESVFYIWGDLICSRIHSKVVQSTYSSSDASIRRWCIFLMGKIMGKRWRGIYIIEDMLIAADWYWLENTYLFKNINNKHRKNCECCPRPVSQLIVR